VLLLLLIKYTYTTTYISLTFLVLTEEKEVARLSLLSGINIVKGAERESSLKLSLFFCRCHCQSDFQETTVTHKTKSYSSIFKTMYNIPIQYTGQQTTHFHFNLPLFFYLALSRVR